MNWKRSQMKTIYLVLAVVGAVVPYFYFIQHFANNGFSIIDFVSAIFVNPAASGFTIDLLISSLVFWLTIFYQFRQGRGPRPLLFVIMNLTIGLSCALPAYLYAKEKNAGPQMA